MRDEYDSLSINDMMTDYSYYSTEIAPNSCGVMDYRLQSDSLEKNKIKSEDDIDKLEVTVRITDESYHDLDTAKMIYTK